MALVHHELCFGCGRSNLFGLLLDVEPTGGGTVAGRWFVKQDHQGPTPGQAHPGILACALLEAITLADGSDLEPTRLEFELEPGGAVRVGSFCEIEAATDHDGDGPTRARATASVDGRLVAALTCSFAQANPGKESP